VSRREGFFASAPGLTCANAVRRRLRRPGRYARRCPALAVGEGTAQHCAGRVRPAHPGGAGPCSVPLLSVPAGTLVGCSFTASPSIPPVSRT